MNLKENIQHTLHRRLLLFLILLVITLLMGLIIILLITGNINAGIKESEDFIINEYSDISTHITEYYDNLTAEAVGLSRILSLNIESKLKEQGLNISSIKNDPKLLESIIEGELYQVLMYMNKSKSSGAFVILDATINNRLPGSELSKAGLYFKNMEPNIVNSTSPTIYVLRGSQNIAYKNRLPLHPEWKMEFNVSIAPYFNMPMEKALNSKLPISKLYYWSPAITLPDSNEEIMMCSVPLIDSEGNVFGVCGLDITSMLYKLTFMPNNSMYQRIFCMISPISNNLIKTEESLFSGGFIARNTIDIKDLTISKGKSSLYYYENEESAFIGYHDLIKMYPEDSVFSSDKWILSIMIPREDVQNYIAKANLKLFYVCSLFMILGLVASVILSRFYIKPIYTAIDTFKDNPDCNLKTNIQEIDELIEYLSFKCENTEKEKESNSDSAILNEFLTNLKTLSPAERSVFNLYAQDYSAKDIADKLCLSINTIKTHTKHIYSKLYIKSKDELLLYVEMLKETGKL